MDSFKDLLFYIEKAVQHQTAKSMEMLWNNQLHIEKTLGLFSDDMSKKLYLRELAQIALGNFMSGEYAATLPGFWSSHEWQALLAQDKTRDIHPEMVIPPAMAPWGTVFKTTTFINEQYKYEDKVAVENGDVCLDIGACLGDVSLWMCENGATRIYAFEIDKANIECMRATFAKNGLTEIVSIVEKAVADKQKRFYYQPCDTNIGAGRITEGVPNNKNYYEITATSIDDYCEENNIRPDFIKMDIEGAEPLAINGARNILQRYRPKFAICVYHAPEHRWSIPLALAEICNDYDFYLKKSAPKAETVLLGCPKPVLFAGRKNAFDVLNDIMIGGEQIFKKVFQMSPELALSPGMDGDASHLILWAWQTGRYKSPLLKEKEDSLADALKKMHKTPHAMAKTPAYTWLIHAVWLYRDDLDQFNCRLESGQQQMIAWFYKYGIDELELRHIVFLP